MPSPEATVNAFARLLGRQPGEAEVARLLRVKDALNLNDNDALWMVLFVLEAYDAEFRRFPKQLAQEADRVLDRVRAESRSIASAEAARAQHRLADAVSKTSRELASDAAHRSMWIATGVALSAASILGAVCMVAGFVLAKGQAPFWLTGQHGHPALLVVRYVLAAPAGWFVLPGLALSSAAIWWRSKAPASLGKVIGTAALVGVALVVGLSMFV